MPNDDQNQLSAELLNDFYAECDEHLNVVRQAIVTLEQSAGQRVGPVIEKLFRSFHSLKGIVGMAGIRPAEELAHQTEDYLRELSREKIRLTPEGIDLLANAVQLLEQSVASFRERRDQPDTRRIIQQIAALIPQSTLSEESEPRAEAKETPEDVLQRKITEAAQQGLTIWKAVFSPTPALNERGVNVNKVRETLGAFGQIIHAAPHISPGGVAFEFHVASQQDLAGVRNWNEEGVAIEKVAAQAGGRQTQPTGAAPTNLIVAPSQVIRVELKRLDDLMRIAGELVIQRARLEEQIERVGAKHQIDTRDLHEVNLGFARQFRELRETVMRLRMVPIAEIFDRLPFVVRDLTRGTDRKVRLELRGQQTELDKYVVERLKEPLLHLVRNAVSHGIEDANEREAKGKPPEATLTLSASTSGETVIINISDDGRGIEETKVAERAREMGVEVPSSLDSVAILDLICLPGFSTREEADRAAGRGAGMAVVSNTLRELGGNLFLDTQPGRGTRFTLRLPLTLLITDALIISSCDQKYAIPQNSVEEVVQIEEQKVKRMERAELFPLRGTALPLIRLRSLFGFPKSDRAFPSVLISQTDRGRVGLVVDRIIGQRQVVVRSLRDPLVHVPGVIGATELGDGRPLLILDPTDLARHNDGRLSSHTATMEK